MGGWVRTQVKLELMNDGCSLEIGFMEDLVISRGSNSAEDDDYLYQ